MYVNLTWIREINMYKDKKVELKTYMKRLKM